MVSDTRELAKRIRIHALRMTNLGGGSHIGSCLSVADIIAVLYGKILKQDPKNPKLAERDRFILSKGHAGAAVYAALAECGYFPTEKLKSHYQNGSDLSGHVSHKNVPGVEFSTGSLGHGLSVCAGIALAAKLDGKAHRVFSVLSEGDCDEGASWEAAMFAAHHKLDNLTIVIDYNKLQSLDPPSVTLGLEPFLDKWISFGWQTVEVDGHDHTELERALSKKATKDKPSCIIAHTVKGKGVSFMENTVLWHYRVPVNDEYNAALAELEGAA